MGFLGGANGREPACQYRGRDRVLSLGWDDPLEKGMAAHFSILAWRIPWTEEPGRLQSMGSHRVRHDQSNLACTHKYVRGAEAMVMNEMRDRIMNKKRRGLRMELWS